MTSQDGSDIGSMRVMHLDGSSDLATLDNLEALLGELEDANDEENEVGVGDPYGWFVSAFASGTVVLSHAERPHEPELVLYGVDATEMLAIFTEIFEGRVDTALGRDWIKE